MCEAHGSPGRLWAAGSGAGEGLKGRLSAFRENSSNLQRQKPFLGRAADRDRRGLHFRSRLSRGRALARRRGESRPRMRGTGGGEGKAYAAAAHARCGR